MRAATATLVNPGYAMFTPRAVNAAATRARWGAAVRFARNLALFAAAPFIGLAYALAFPVVGLGMLVWLAVRREPVAG